MADWTQLSPSHSSRNGAQVRLLAIHTAEGATTAAGLANYLANPDNQVSYHDVADDSNGVQCVEYVDKARALRSGNPVSDNFCLTAFAAWSRTTWLSHTGMVERAAAWIAARAQARGIPIVKLSSADVAAGKSGVIGHWDWTVGMKDGSHTDPGSNFPWDVVMLWAAELAGLPTPEAAPIGTYAGPYRNGSRDVGAPTATGGSVWRIQDRLKRAYAAYAGQLVTDASSVTRPRPPSASSSGGCT
jgi:hypothetical protein